MTHHDEVVATDRLRRALLAFRSAHSHSLAAHRRLKDLPQVDVEAFWNGQGVASKRICALLQPRWLRPSRPSPRSGWSPPPVTGTSLPKPSGILRKDQHDAPA